MQKNATYIPPPTCPDRPILALYQQVPSSLVTAAEGKADAIHMAAELGRLDVVSISLTMLATAIAIATVLGFWFYSRVVENAAKRETVEILPHVVEKYLRENPGVLANAVKKNMTLISLGVEGDGEGRFSDDIAAAMEGDGSKED
jgi:hypothetical protein